MSRNCQRQQDRIARPLGPRTGLACVAVVWLATSAGCQSGVERDIIQREMRQQEDQIYALQDYVAQYEQMVCQYRAENESLKRQICESGPAEQQARPGRGATTKKSTTPPRAKETPIPPSLDRGEGPPGNLEMAPPEVPPLEFNQPEVPPLDDTSSNGYEAGRDAPPVAKANPPDPAPVSYPAESVALRGQVQLDDAASGPRVLVEIDPLTARGHRARFHGSVSLMFVDPSDGNLETNLARWDFAPEDLGQNLKESSADTPIRFPLQLPADVPTDRPVELWVRLVPTEGNKMLGHTAVDLSRPGRFASAGPKLAAPQPDVPTAVTHPVRTASAELPATRRSNHPVRQSGWTVARPGEIAESERPRQESSATWRAATQPIPLVESTPVRNDPFSSAPTPPDRIMRNEPDELRTASQWEPERPSDSSSQDSIPVARSWSPTR